MSKFHKAGLA